MRSPAVAAAGVGAVAVAVVAGGAEEAAEMAAAMGEADRVEVAWEEGWEAVVG